MYSNRGENAWYPGKNVALNVQDEKWEIRQWEKRQLAAAELAAANKKTVDAAPYHSVYFYPAGHYSTNNASKLIEPKGHYGLPRMDLTLDAAKFAEEIDDVDIAKFALALPFLKLSKQQNDGAAGVIGDSDRCNTATIHGLAAGGLVAVYRDGTTKRFCFCRSSSPLDAPHVQLSSKSDAAFRARQLHCLQTMPPRYIWNDGGMYSMQNEEEA